MNNRWIQQYLQQHRDFPKSGVVFQWYGELLRDPMGFHEVMGAFWERYQDYEIDTILGLESRGFIFAGILAYEMEIPFVLVRKCGKLPEPTLAQKFEREYGTDCFEIEEQDVGRALIIDDLLASGGSMRAACQLVERVGGEVVEAATLLEIGALKGREKLNVPYFSFFKL